MPTYDAGNAALQIFPSFRGVQAQIRKEAQKWGLDSGKAYADSFNAAVRGETGKTPLGPSKPTATKAGTDSGGSFADGFKKRVEAALKSLPDVKIGAATSQAEQKIKDLSVQLKALSDKRIGVDIDDRAALAELDRLRAELVNVSATSGSIQVRADTSAALMQLDRLREDVDKVSAMSPTVNVDADTAQAEAQLAGVKAASDDLGRSSPTISPNVDAAPALAGIATIKGALLGLGALSAFSVLGPLAAGVAALGGPLVAAGTGLVGVAAVAAPAIGRIKDAVSAQSKATADAGKTATSSAAAQKAAAGQIASAQLSLSDARRNAAQQAIAGSRAVAQAETQAASQRATAVGQVKTAEQALATAETTAKQAQQSLTQARKEAADQLRQLAFQNTDAALAERGATLAVEEAQQNLNATKADPKASSLQRKQAQLSYDQAVQALKEQKAQTKELAAQKAAADKKGIKGSDQVVAAQQNIAKANTDVKDKQAALVAAQKNVTAVQVAGAQAVADAQTRAAAQQADAASSIKRAQLGMASAMDAQVKASSGSSASADALRKALGKLTPAEKEVMAAFLDLRKSFSGWAKDLEPEVLPAFTGGLRLLKGALAPLTPVVAGAAGAIAGLETKAGKAFQGPFWQNFAKFLGKETPIAITGLGTAFGNLATGLAGLFQGLAPLGNSILGTIDDITGKLSNFGQSAAKGTNKPFNAFVAFERDTGPQLLKTLGDIFTLAGNIASGLAPSVKPTLRLLSDVASGLNPVILAVKKYLPGVITDIDKVIKKAAPLLAALSDPFVKGIADTVHTFGRFLGGVADVIDRLPPEVVKPVAQALGILVGVFALSKLTGLSKMAGWLTAAGRAGSLAAPGIAAASAASGFGGGIVPGAGGTGGKAAGKAGKVSKISKIGSIGGKIPFYGQMALIGVEISHLITQTGPMQKFQRTFFNWREDLDKLPGALGLIGGATNDMINKIDDAIGNVVKIPGQGKFSGHVNAILPSGKEVAIKVTGQETFKKALEDAKKLADGVAASPRVLKLMSKDDASRTIKEVGKTADNVGKKKPNVHLSATDKASLTVGKVGSLADKVGTKKPNVKMSATDKASQIIRDATNKAQTLGKQKPDVKMSATDGASKIIGGVTGGLGKLRTATISVKEHLKDLANKAYKITVSATGSWSADAAKGTAAAPMLRRAHGGYTGTNGREGVDSIHALLAPKEYVTRSAIVNREGVDKFDALNAGRATIVPRFAAGGFVDVQESNNLGNITSGADSFLKKNITKYAKKMAAQMQTVGGGAIIAEAMKYLGTPYVWGGSAPGGFDCSGLVQYVLGKLGIHAPRTAAMQQDWATPESKGDARPGDEVFWGNPAHHTAFYMGGGKILQAPQTGDVVKISNLFGSPTFGREQGLGKDLSKLLGGTNDGSAGATASGTSARAAQTLAFELLSTHGWGPDQMGPLKSLWQGESNWNHLAANPTSSAFGIAQFLDSTWGPYGPKTTDVGKQVAYGESYIASSYGNPQNAYNKWLSRSPHWYGGGLDGGIFTKPTLIGVGDGGPERVDVTPLRGYASGGEVKKAPALRGTTFTSTALLSQAGEHLIDVILASFRGSRARSTIDAASQSILASIDKVFTGSKKSGLVSWTKVVNGQLDRLATERDKIASRITAANTVASGLTDAAKTFGSISSIGGTTDPAGILNGLRSKRDYIVQFGANLKKLAKLHFSKSLIAQIVALGPDGGGALADQLVHSTAGQVKDINAVQKSIGTVSTQLGTTGVNAQFGGNLARGFVGGLQTQENSLEKQMARLAQVFAKGVGKSFHLKGYAGGGGMRPGELGVVGEEGPELFRAGRSGATLFSTPESAAAVRAAYGGFGQAGRVVSKQDLAAQRYGQKASFTGSPVNVETMVVNDATDADIAGRRLAHSLQAMGVA